MAEPEEDLDEGALLRLLAAQDGVVSRAQVRAAGAGDLLIRRRLRRREWARVHEGVYVDHTGPLTWRQRAWAAVLVHWPAALAGASALRAHGVTGPGVDSDDIEVVVDRSRRVDAAAGVAVSQVGDLDAAAQLHLSPPRVRVEHATLTVAARARSEDAVVAVVAEVVRLRRTTPRRLRAALAGRPRLRHTALLREVLTDVAVGVESALERRYLRDVERAHGLPTGRRQAPGDGARGRVYRGVVQPCGPGRTLDQAWIAVTRCRRSSPVARPWPPVAARGRPGPQNEVTTATPGCRPTSTSAGPAWSRDSSRVTRSWGRSRPAAIIDSIAG